MLDPFIVFERVLLPPSSLGCVELLWYAIVELLSGCFARFLHCHFLFFFVLFCALQKPRRDPPGFSVSLSQDTGEISEMFSPLMCRCCSLCRSHQQPPWGGGKDDVVKTMATLFRPLGRRLVCCAK